MTANKLKIFWKSRRTVTTEFGFRRKEQNRTVTVLWWQMIQCVIFQPYSLTIIIPQRNSLGKYIDLTFFANAISCLFSVTIPKKVLMLELKWKLFPSMTIQRNSALTLETSLPFNLCTTVYWIRVVLALATFRRVKKVFFRFLSRMSNLSRSSHESTFKE